MSTFFKSRRRVVVVIACLSLAILLVLIILPSLRPRRELNGPSHRIAANLRGIALSCLVYASDNNDHFPPHPVILLLDGSVYSTDFCNREVEPLMLPDPPPPVSSWPTLAADLDQHSVFIYTGGDLTQTIDPAIIIAYTKKSRLIPNYRILAFADAHIETIPDAQLPGFFAASNAARAQLKLPPFTLDGPPPAPPK